MKRCFLLFVLLTLVCGALCAADLTGKWTGKFDFNGQSVPLTFDFKNSGADLSGTVNGLPTPTAEIKDGKVKDKEVTFWLMIDYQGNPVKLVYNGKIDGDQINFTMGTEDGSFSVSFPVKKGDA